MFASFSLGATAYIYDNDGRLNTGEYEFLGTTDDIELYDFFLRFKEYVKSDLATKSPAQTVKNVYELSEKESSLMWNMLKNEGFREGDIYQVWVKNYRHEIYLIVEIQKNEESYLTLWYGFEIVPLEE